MTTKIDWTKPIETTDGRPAKVDAERCYRRLSTTPRHQS